MTRVYLDVPYAEKDEAKALGAKWCPEVRLWYVPRGLSRKLFRWADALTQSVEPSKATRVIAKTKARSKRKMASVATKQNNLSPNPLRGTSRRLQQELATRLDHLLDE